jgi:hypothetical protein
MKGRVTGSETNYGLKYVTSEVSMVVTTKIIIFWDVVL